MSGGCDLLDEILAGGDISVLWYGLSSREWQDIKPEPRERLMSYLLDWTTKDRAKTRELNLAVADYRKAEARIAELEAELGAKLDAARERMTAHLLDLTAKDTEKKGGRMSKITCTDCETDVCNCARRHRPLPRHARITCPDCAGTGKQHGFACGPNVSMTEWQCFTCDGAGSLDADKVAVIRHRAAMGKSLRALRESLDMSAREAASLLCVKTSEYLMAESGANDKGVVFLDEMRERTERRKP